MARVIAVVNAKGGVGKTTTAVNVGAYLAFHGKRTLLVDFDPQGNASSALGHNPLQVDKSVYHGILGEAEAKDLVKPSIIYNFHLVPSAPHLAGALVELVGMEGREYLLRQFLHRIRHEYDYVIIDLAPSLTLLTVNALIASDEILIPVQAEYYSLEGLSQLLETIELIRNNMGHPVSVMGAVLTMVDKNQKLTQEVAKNLRSHFPHRVFETEIPRSSPLAEAPSFAIPVLLHRPDSAGAVAYRKLAREIIALENVSQSLLKTQSAGFGNFNNI